MAPVRVVEWLRRNYPKPTVDPEWLEACLNWISEELGFSDLNSQADAIISNVDSQLLNSDLHDSMLAGTGLPHFINVEENTCLKGSVLVQIQGITDIGHSAFSLQNVQQTRLDRADLAGLAEEEGEDEEEGPIPKYPRGMLRFDLSDGSNSLRAIEYRRMPELELGTTPLGYKMILKDVPIRRGIAFLEPSNVILKGYMTEELDANRAADFARGLRMRLGQPEPEPDNLDASAGNPPGPLPPPQGASIPASADGPPSRVPLREVTEDDPIVRRPARESAREELEPPTRRRVPVVSDSVSVSASSTVTSPYFSNATPTSTTLASSSDLTSMRLSPVLRTALPSSTLSDKAQSAPEDCFDFSDDMPIDDAFLQELEAAEQAAMNSAQQRDRGNDQVPSDVPVPFASDQSQVIVIDSDEENKENLAPISQRRVRRRVTVPDDESDIIIIE